MLEKLRNIDRELLGGGIVALAIGFSLYIKEWVYGGLWVNAFILLLTLTILGSLMIYMGIISGEKNLDGVSYHKEDPK